MIEGKGICEYLEAVSRGKIKPGCCVAVGEGALGESSHFFYKAEEDGFLQLFPGDPFVPPTFKIWGELKWYVLEERPKCTDVCQKI